jgi:hypothetical protein
MGLLNFWNKKKVDHTVLSPLTNLDISTDLPSIDGSNLPSLDGVSNSLSLNTLPDSHANASGSMNTFMRGNIDLNVPPNADLASNVNSVNSSKTFNSQEFTVNTQLGTPSLNAPSAIPPPLESKSLSVNIPTLDFSMPPSDDDAPLIAEPVKPSGTVIKESKPDDKAYLDVEDLKKLFIGDEWKEPDWNNFEAYHEDKIDEPNVSDFGQDLPKFNEEEQISEPSSIEKQIIPIPVELFIRGSEYSRAFSELDLITKAIVKIDSRLGNYESIIKHEESLFLESKNQMENLYKKLTLIDKKIFVQ